MKRPSLTFYLSFIFALFYLGVLPRFLLAIVVALVVAVVARNFLFEKILQRPPPVNAAVLITGTSSGFGQGFAYALAEKGLMVFATVRKQADGDTLVEQCPAGARSLIRIVILDVTDEAQIQTAANEVKSQLAKEKRQLFAVINNSGIQTTGPLETAAPTGIKYVFDVNVFGPLLISQAFIPLLREFTGAGGARIIFLGSAAGLISIPFFGAYCASKQAIEAVADCLRMELQMRKDNIQVTIVEPGQFKTEMGGKLVKEASQRLEQKVEKKEGEIDRHSRRNLYEGPYEKHFLQQANSLQDYFPPRTLVVTSVLTALFAYFPPRRMTIGSDTILAISLNSIYSDIVHDFIWVNRLPARLIRIALGGSKKKSE